MRFKNWWRHVFKNVLCDVTQVMTLWNSAKETARSRDHPSRGFRTLRNEDSQTWSLCWLQKALKRSYRHLKLRNLACNTKINRDDCNQGNHSVVKKTCSVLVLFSYCHVCCVLSTVLCCNFLMHYTNYKRYLGFVCLPYYKQINTIIMLYTLVWNSPKTVLVLWGPA